MVFALHFHLANPSSFISLYFALWRHRVRSTFHPTIVLSKYKICAFFVCMICYAMSDKLLQLSISLKFKNRKRLKKHNMRNLKQINQTNEWMNALFLYIVNQST